MSKVFVYRNLHFRDQVMYSIKLMKTQKVIGREPVIALSDVVFKVSEAGRQRVLRDRRKNVHAGVIGMRCELFSTEGLVKVTYDPYRFETFVICDSGEPIRKAERVVINESGVWAKI